MPLSTGTRLGPYEIVAALGAGGMGEVYRARDTRLGRDVAVKILPAHVAAAPEARQRFEREARAVSSLNHPHICALFDIGTENGVDFIVMEHLAGESLSQRLERGPLPIDQALKYAVQIADALDRAHRQEVVHRDLKPSNVMLTKDGAKLLDFGLAKVRASAAASEETRTLALTTEGTVLGTVQYMSPEQVEGKDADARADIFSFGALLYECITGRKAFEGKTRASVMAAVLERTPAPMSELKPVTPAALDRVVQRCLAKEPDDRWQSARDLKLELDWIASGATATRATAPAAPRRWWPAVIIAIAALATVAVALFIGMRLPAPGVPAFQRLTFRRGTVRSARFAPDGRSIVYSAAWEGRPQELFLTLAGSPEYRSLGITNASILSISSKQEMALRVGENSLVESRGEGTLARAPLVGGTPREMLEHVKAADWSPDGDSLAVVRLADGKSRLEYPVGTLLYETPQDIPTIRVSPKGDLLAFPERSLVYGIDTSICVIDRRRNKRRLASGYVGDSFDLAWSRAGDVWFDNRSGGDDILRAVTLGSKVRTLAQLPDPLQLFDIAADGRALVGRSTLRAGIMGLAPGATSERDYSWLDMSEVDGVSADGKTLLITEYGKGGGVGKWSAYLRKTDGSPAVRLGEGQAMALSADAKRILTTTVSPQQIVVLPVGAGEPVKLVNHGISAFFWAAWLPDQKSVVFLGQEAGHGLRLYLQQGDQARPISAEGIRPVPFRISRDGQTVAAMGTDGLMRLYPVAGGPSRPLPGVGPDDSPVGWTADSRTILVANYSKLPVEVRRIDVATGVSHPWRNIQPPDTTGLVGVFGITVAPDLSWYYYSYRRDISDLYLVEGMR